MPTLGPIVCGRRNSPPAPATSDRLTSGNPKAALVEATMRSQERAISHPPASAGPSTAAMIGLRRWRGAMAAKAPLLGLRPPALPEAVGFRSAPARKNVAPPATSPNQTAG